MITVIRFQKGNLKVQYKIQENPKPGTFGDYILLKRRLLEEAGSNGILESIRRKDEYRYKQIVFNMNFLKKMRELHKKLHCVYCGRDDLQISELYEKRKSNVATTDHFLPRSLYPDLEFQESNLRVCCDKCNCKKAQNIWEEKFPYN